MSEKLIRICSIFLIALLVVVTYIEYTKNSEYEDSNFRPVMLSGHNFIINNTDLSYADTIVSVGMDVLGIKGEHVNIKMLRKTTIESFRNGDNLQLEGAIIKKDNGYIIFLKPDSKRNMMSTLAHELLHLKQYTENRLEIEGRGRVRFNDRTYNIDEVSYLKRPWEIEAFRGQELFRRQLELQLFEEPYGE